MSGSDIFNPYSKWLAIPPEDQPPNHYRLLGIRLFEGDPDVIEAAAEQRTGFLRKHQSGSHGSEAGRLLNDVAAARICLLNPDKKTAYDQQLQPPLPQIMAPVVTSTSAGKRVPYTGLIMVGVLLVSGVGLAAWWLTPPAPRLVEKTPVARRAKSADGKSSVKETEGLSPLKIAALPKDKVTPSPTTDKPSTHTFRLPQGTLTAEAVTPAQTPAVPAIADKPTEPNTAPPSPSPAPVQPADQPGDAKLLAAIAQLDKANQIAAGKFFKKLKTKLAECKDPPKKQKAHSPALLAELDKMLAKCDQNEFPVLRVQGTKSFNGHDYAYVNVDYTWNTARELCEAMGGHLVTLNTPEETAFVETTFLRPNGKQAWLGAGDQAKEGEWHWVTGEPWSFQAWIDNEWGFAHALTWAQAHGFHDAIGDYRLGYVCEWETAASPELIALSSDIRIFQTIWEARIQARLDQMEQRQKRFKAVHQAALRMNKETGTDQGRDLYAKFGFETPPPQRFASKKSEYFLFREAKTWHEAEAHCERMGGHLVILDDPAEAEEVFRQALQNEITIFIGCFDEYKEGQWRWVNGDLVKLRMERDNFHGHDHAGVVYVNKDVNGKRPTPADAAAGARIAYVCEWELE